MSLDVYVVKRPSSVFPADARDFEFLQLGKVIDDLIQNGLPVCGIYTDGTQHVQGFQSLNLSRYLNTTTARANNMSNTSEDIVGQAGRQSA